MLKEEAAASFFVCLNKAYVIDFISLKSVFLNGFALKYADSIKRIGRKRVGVV